MSRRPPSAAHSTSSDFQQHEVPTTSSNGGAGGSGIKLKLSLGRHHPENLNDPNAGDHDHVNDDNDDHDDEMVGGGHGRLTRTAASAGGGGGGIATRSRNSGGRRASASASSTASSPQQRLRAGAGGAGGGRVTRSAVGGGSINYNEDAAAAAVDDDDRDGDDLGIFDDDQDAPAARAASTRSRRSTTALNGGSRGGGGGGSGRRRSNNSGGDDVGEDDEDAEGEPDEPPTSPPVAAATTRSGRQIKKKTYAESDVDFDDEEEDDSDAPRRRSAATAAAGRRGKRNSMHDFVEPDEEGDEGETSQGRSSRRDRMQRLAHEKRKQAAAAASSSVGTRRSTRRGTAARRNSEDDYEDEGELDDDLDGEGEEEEEDELDLHDESSGVDSPEKSRRPTRGATAAGGRRKGGRSAAASEEETDAPVARTLRARKTGISYALPPLIEDLPRASRGVGGASSRIGGSSYGKRAAEQNNGFLFNMGLGMGAVDPTAGMGNLPDSDSDDEVPGFVRDLRREAAAGMELANGGSSKGKEPAAAAAAGATTATVAAGSVGRYDPEAAKADADPLGVDLNVTFDQVGGLDGHINQLKEMVALPLLYPELFQQFGITPPRGVLFHGPPGTGKTLLARALAASCSSSTQKIAFFMRKGADCLSKWVGEAERQLRLLFEEAKNAQPSIIFFDEIDGLAPVRSAKQDQIHSSLVATLLALMDGMDGRGQVVVIGATNRPDNVDPALRRPGRFDREFYFPLPNLEARKKIIQINTQKWEPPLDEPFVDQLATLTKGYGGADLRALCTEAALNAIQRRYPQVYKTTDRLLLDPGSIQVQARDFMHSVKKIVPSSARSAASSAAPLPAQLRPLLAPAFERVKAVAKELIPDRKRPSVLEEAEWEHDEDDGTFAREMLLQSLETLRIYRPRLIIHGHKGMGQRAIGAALLHHLEGYHVQNLDIASLLGQTNGSPEQTMVQMFVEAKRHQPSILYIPALVEWSLVLTDSAKATFGALLDSLTPEEPVMLVALVDGEVNDVPADVRSWFGYTGTNCIELELPRSPQREQFFRELLQGIYRPPTEYPDGLPKRRRVLEALPTAPPLPPKPPSAAAIQAQKQKDTTLREILTYRLGPILAELKKKHRRVMIPAKDAFAIHEAQRQDAEARDAAETEAQNQPEPEPEPAPAQQPPQPSQADGEDKLVETADGEDVLLLPAANPSLPDAPPASTAAPAAAAAVVAPKPPITRHVKSLVKPHYVDFDLMQNKLIDPNEGYLELRTFLRDMERMAENVMRVVTDDGDRRQKAHAAVVEAKLLLKDHFQDEQQKLDFERMAAREYARREKERPKRPTSPVRHSPRVNGEAPEFNMVNNPEEIAKDAKKRNRAESNAPESPHGPVSKRQRAEVANGHDGTAAMAGGNAGMSVGHPFHHQQQQHQPTPHSPSMPMSNGHLAPRSPFNQPPMSPQRHPHPGAAPMIPSPLAHHPHHHHQPSQLPQPQQPPRPMLFVPHHMYVQLAQLLIEETENQTVEELEQLRAASLGCVWRHRASWDKTQLLREMLATANAFITQVKSAHA